jgi:LmbE family N-acetylglucosaminyl deacetylase
VREAELRAACAVVGVTDVRIVGTPDGGTVADEAGVERIAATMRELKPAVVVTMEPQGVTHHPDHIAVSKMTTDAFERVRPEGFLQRFYYAALPETWLKTLSDELERRGLPAFFKPDDPLAPRAAPDESVACMVDCRRWAHRKAEALRAHRTQSMEMIAWMPDEIVEPVLGPEAFQRQYPPRADGDPLEDDLFAALRGPDGKLR